MSVYNTRINQSFLEQIEIMSTDIRQQKKDIAAAKAAAQVAQGTAQDAQGTAANAVTIGQAAQQAADLVSGAVQVITGTIETISVEMVRKSNSGPIAATAFILDAVRGYYYATFVHGLNDAAPDIEVYDADKDKQRIQSIIVDNNTIELELDAEDLASNSFPLTCIVLGKTAPAPSFVMMPGGEFTYRLLNGVVQRGNGVGENFSDIYMNVVTAFLSADSRVYAYLADGTTNWKLDGSDINNVISLSDYSDAKMLPTSIDL